MVFTMHRLVQLTVRTWLKTYGQEEEWKERFIENLYTDALEVSFTSLLSLILC
jgi:hypothetical protein